MNKDLTSKSLKKFIEWLKSIGVTECEIGDMKFKFGTPSNVNRLEPTFSEPLTEKAKELKKNITELQAKLFEETEKKKIEEVMYWSS